MILGIRHAPNERHLVVLENPVDMAVAILTIHTRTFFRTHSTSLETNTITLGATGRGTGAVLHGVCVTVGSASEPPQKTTKNQNPKQKKQNNVGVFFLCASERERERESMTSPSQEEGVEARRLVCLDLETGGLNFRQHEVFQLAAIFYPEKESFVRLIRVSTPLSEVVLRVTGYRYTNEQLAQQPTFPEVMREFIEWLDQLPGKGPIYWMAYNGLKFDFKFLTHQMLRAGLNPYLLGISMFVDLFPWCKRMLHADHRQKLPVNEKSGEPSFTLGNVHQAVVGTTFAAHDALEDVRAMIRILDVIQSSDLYTPGDREVLYQDPLCIQSANTFIQTIQDDFRNTHSDQRKLVHKAVSQKQILMLQKPGLLLVRPEPEVKSAATESSHTTSGSLESLESLESQRDGEGRKRKSGRSTGRRTHKKRKVQTTVEDQPSGAVVCQTPGS